MRELITFDIFFKNGQTEMSSAEKQTRCPSVYVVIVYMQVCALGGSAFQRLFTLLRGKAKAGEKGLRCNNCES